MSNFFSAALEAWRAELGPSEVLTDSEAAERYGICTTPLQRRIAGALIPSDTAQVSTLVRIAAQHKIPLYPISTGRNWGYGSANPTQDNCVVVDLSRMDRILDMDRELGVVTVQPGVTQGQLSRYLQDNDLSFLVPVTGAGPDCSLVGNALERGYGITPIADHFAAVTSLEAVLADGSLYRSALSEMGGGRIDKSYKWSVGPYLDGLFAQGNMGIVTQMSLALARRPERIEAFFFSTRDAERLPQLVEAVREVLAELPGITGSINLMNRHRVLAMTCPYPHDRVGAQGVLPPEVVAALGAEHRIMPWTGAGALYGRKEVVAAARRVLRKILRPTVDRLLFLDAGRLRQLRTLSRWLPAGGRAQRMLHTAEAALELMEGKPSQVALPLAYWRSGVRPTTIKIDPARDGCGLIWYPPLVPMTGAEVNEYVAMVEAICTAHGIEPLITLTSQSERCFDSSVPLLFDKTDPAATERALACYAALFEAGKQRGFLPYRLGVHAMESFTHSGTPFWKLAATVKSAVDPDGIIAPGRYSPPRD